jgi:hypothetical protein
MGRPQQGREEQVLLDNSAAGARGSGSPRPTLVLDDKPVDKHGPRSLQVRDDVRHGGDLVQEFARFVTLGRRFQQEGSLYGEKEQEQSKR